MRLVTLLQSDHRDEQTWPNQQKDKDARIREAKEPSIPKTTPKPNQFFKMSDSKPNSLNRGVLEKNAVFLGVMEVIFAFS